MPKAALLVMDVQRGIVERYADDAEYLPRLGTAIAAARAADVPVIYVQVAFRPGYPEVSQRNRGFSAIAGSGAAFSTEDAATEIHPAVAPAAGEVLVTKRRVSAFSGSDLDVVLRSGEIDTLVLTGIATSGVVLSTLRQAADLDYGLMVLSDGCLDGDPEVHGVLVEKVFPRQAEVTTIAEWTTSLP
ncbi:cysteine hydrolase [Saccharopolyspora sp. K220]|uniref:cysteine hydrolase family protein n=1 Tax=Saccharopolyspora soli TaxID=2926618 RepID=UPI001F59F7DF|nr:isochorismatase family cysteine hydrolase [Saccharopolyspora soli]MCI2418396.1 cysteine hydrolase [Saccharopolyspora soli]